MELELEPRQQRERETSFSVPFYAQRCGSRRDVICPLSRRAGTVRSPSDQLRKPLRLVCSPYVRRCSSDGLGVCQLPAPFICPVRRTGRSAGSVGTTSRRGSSRASKPESGSPKHKPNPPETANQDRVTSRRPAENVINAELKALCCEESSIDSFHRLLFNVTAHFSSPRI